MNASTVRKLSIFIFIVPAMTTLVIGTATTFATSNTHTHHHIQQIANDDSWTSSFTHAPYLSTTGGSDDLGSLGYTQYGSGSHQQQDHSSTDMMTAIDGDNSNSTANSLEPGSFSSIEYAWNHPHHHHHHSSTDMMAAIDGDNSNSTANSLEPGSFSSIEYAWNHPHHHHNNMIVDIK
jgi:hypothetical protein